MALNTPPTPNLPPANINVAPREQVEDPPAKRRRVENPSFQFLESCGASRRLEARIQSIGGWDNLDGPVERPRYQLLSEACDMKDLVFIALHQLFCTWTVRRADVYQLCTRGVHFPNVIDAAFHIIETLLRSNSTMKQGHIEWFAEFPAPLVNIGATPIYASVLRQVLDFLMRLCGKWQSIHDGHQANGYPFLMTEFVNDLLLFSPLLQTIMFRASRRSLGILDGPAASHIEGLFKSDQQHHRAPDGTITRLTPSPEYESYNITLAKQYKTLVARSRLQGHYQSGQHPNAPGTQSIQQPGLYPPTMNHQIRPELSRNTNHVSGFQPHPIILPSNSAVPGTGTLLSIPTPSPVNTSAPFMNPVPAGFTLPSSPFAPNSPVSMLSSPSGPFPQPNNAHIQAQFGHPNSEAQVIPAQLLRTHQIQMQHQLQIQQELHQQHILHQQLRQQQPRHMPVRRLSRQGGHITSTSPRPTPSPTGVHGQFYLIHPTGQLQDIQNANGQPGQLPRSPNPAGYMSNNGIPTPIGSTNTQPASPQARLTNRYQGPANYSQQNLHYQQHKSDNDRLIPEAGVTIPLSSYPRSPYCEISVKASLHQAHLRSPKRMPQELVSAKPERYYQAVKSFALSPTATAPRAHLQKFEFYISELDHARITRDVVKPGGFYPVNLFSSGSLRVRIRCCYKKKSSTPFSDSTWVITDTKWPEHIFMELNNHTLSIMRKAHHSKDQPVEASSFVVPGENLLSVYIPEKIKVPQGQETYIAVEIVEVLSHSAVLQMVKTFGTVPADSTREIIKGRLGGSLSSNTDDDELEMVSNLSIDLADPFSCCIFNVPVRGKTCTHLECFDLETWLNTRLGKKSCYCGRESACTKCPKEPSFVDKWKCPLCDKDARPYSLRVDDFLVEVRAKLESENKLGTKSIVVSSDGTWKPKEEPGGDDSGSDSDEDVKFPARQKPVISSSTLLQREKAPIEVIELD